MERRVQILTQTEVKRALMRLSYEIIEKSEDLDKVVLAGIHTRGIPISEILRDNIEKNTGKKLPLCTLDITFYRDDLSKKREIPEVKGSLFPVEVNGKEVELTDIEFNILSTLMKNPKQIFSAEQLYEKAWNEPYYYSANNTIMVHIRNLRKKIEKDPANPVYIKTIWGKGYRFE